MAGSGNVRAVAHSGDGTVYGLGARTCGPWRARFVAEHRERVRWIRGVGVGSLCDAQSVANDAGHDAGGAKSLYVYACVCMLACVYARVLAFVTYAAQWPRKRLSEQARERVMWARFATFAVGMPGMVGLMQAAGDDGYMFAVAESLENLRWVGMSGSAVVLLCCVGVASIIETCSTGQRLWRMFDVYARGCFLLSPAFSHFLPAGLSLCLALSPLAIVLPR